jgi:putative endonuclease
MADPGRWHGGKLRERIRVVAVYHVYILASASGVLYTGVTHYLERGVREHKEKRVEGFTKTYDVTRLVYYEPHDQIKAAVRREKQIKGWRREKKLALIRGMNPEFRDLSEDFAK